MGKVLATLAEVVMPLLVVRLLGKADVGALMALFLIYNTLAPIICTGVPQTVMFNLPGRPLEERASIARQIMKLMMVLGVVTAGVLVLLGLGGDRIQEAFSPAGGIVDLSALLLLALFPLGDIPTRMLTNLLVVENHPRGAAGYGLFRSLGMSVCTVVPLALGGDAWSVATWLGVLAAGQLVVLLVYIHRLYGGVARRASPVSYRAILRFGLPLGVTSIVAVLNKFFDRFVILLVFGGTMYAEYEAGAWQVPFITTIPYVIGTSIAPQMVESFRSEQPRDAMRLWRAAINKVSLIVVPVALVFIVATEELVEILFTSKYAAAVPILRWYSILAIGRVASFGEVLVAAGRPGYALQAAGLSFAANIMLSLPLLWWLGFIGPAVGTALAFVASATFYCWRIARASGLRIRDTFPLFGYLRVVALGLVGVVGAVAVKFHFDAPAAVKLAAEGGVLIMSFALLGSLLGLISREDWRYLRNWLRLKF